MKFLRAVFIGLIFLSSMQADASRIRAKLRRAVAVQPGTVTPPLVPGSTAIGSWAASAQPADVNGSTRQVIANWAMVPFQDFDDPFYLEVVAYQAPTSAEYSGGIKNAIASVDFACDGGDWAVITAPTTNAAGHSVYRVQIDPATFSGDGQHECRFRAIPTTGRALVGQGSNINYAAITHSMYLNTNEGNSFTPYTRIVDASGGVDNASCGGGTGASACATLIQAKANIYTHYGSDLGGGVVCLMPGNYSWGTASTVPTIRPAATRWLTVKPCDGVSRSQVTINTQPTSSGVARGIGVAKVRLYNVTTNVGMAPTTNAGSISGDSVPGQEYGWADTVDHNGPGTNLSSIISGSKWKAAYATDSTVDDAQSVGGYLTLVKDVVANNITGDAISNVRTAIGFTITNLDIGIYAPYGAYCISISQGSNAQCGNHTDMLQINRNTTNIIVADVVGVSGFVGAQWFLDNDFSITNAAFVNVRANNQNPTANPGNKLWNLNGNISLTARLTNFFFYNGSNEGGAVSVGTSAIIPFVDSTFVDSTCSNQTGWTTSNQAGITFLGSATCDVP
jgi:hypothetical protein